LAVVFLGAAVFFAAVVFAVVVFAAVFLEVVFLAAPLAVGFLVDADRLDVFFAGLMGAGR
jgi:hypothetical protein